MKIDPTDPARRVPESAGPSEKPGGPQAPGRDPAAEDLIRSGVPSEVVEQVWRREAERDRLRQEKLQRIRRELEEGSYRRPAEQVAERIVHFFRDEEASGGHAGSGDDS